MNELNARLEQLETKHIVMEQFHSQISTDNTFIKKRMDNLRDSEKNLENMLIFAIDSFAPNILMKNEFTIYEKNGSKGEISSNLLKELNSIFISTININLERSNSKDYLDYKYDKNFKLNLNISSFNLAQDNSFIKHEGDNCKNSSYSKLKEIQRSYLNSIEESNYYTIKTSLPRKTNVIQIIENNTEYDAKTNVSPKFYLETYIYKFRRKRRFVE